MSSKSVTVLTVHGRRQTVQVEPNMTVLEILETVCRKYNFAHNEYDLLHHNKPLDLSAMFRFSGLPNNAQLEMAKAKFARKEEDVTVQLQLEDGTRTANGLFQPAQTLLDVLQALCPERANADAHPVLVYMRREVYWDQLAETTLKSLGLTRGRAALRLLQRQTGIPKTQANVSAPLPRRTPKPDLFDEDMSEPSVSQPVPKPLKETLPEPVKEALPEPMKDTLPEPMKESKKETLPEPMKDTPTEAKQETLKESTPEPGTSKGKPSTDVPKPPEPNPSAVIVTLNEHGALLYHASTAKREYETVEDSFFELTAPELRLLYKQLQDQVKELENAPLLTSQQRQAASQNRMLSLMGPQAKVVIRVQFPDRYVLQGVFQATDTIDTVMRFVASFVPDTFHPFYLYTTPPKTVLPPTVTLLDARCFPQALLHFSPKQPADGGASVCYLYPELLTKLSNAIGAGIVAAQAKHGQDVTQPEGSEHVPVERPGTSRLEWMNSSGEASEPPTDEAGPPSNRIPNRNFRQSSNVREQPTSEREAKILKFLKK